MCIKVFFDIVLHVVAVVKVSLPKEDIEFRAQSAAQKVGQGPQLLI